MLINKTYCGYLIATFILAYVSDVSAQNVPPPLTVIGNQYNISGVSQSGTGLINSLQRSALSAGEISTLLSNPNVQTILDRRTGAVIGNQYNISGVSQSEVGLINTLQKLGLSSGEVSTFLSDANVQTILDRGTDGEKSIINALIRATNRNTTPLVRDFTNPKY